MCAAVQVLLICVLGVTTQRTLTRGLDGWRKESTAAAIAKAQPTAVMPLMGSPSDVTATVTAAAAAATAAATVTNAPADAATAPATVPAEEASAHVRGDVALLVFALGVCSLLSRLRGSGKATSLLEVHCGSPSYWGLTVAQLGALVAISLVCGTGPVAQGPWVMPLHSTLSHATMFIRGPRS